MSYIIERKSEKGTELLLDDFKYDAYFGNEFYQGGAEDLRWSESYEDNGPKLPKQFKTAEYACNELNRYLRRMAFKGNEEAGCCDYVLTYYGR